MPNRKIVFIGGIHGAGKGTLCRNLAEKFGFKHLTASKVLKWNEISDLENKQVQNISSNQERLIYNLNQIMESDQKYLLDGHFTLLNTKRVPEKIQVSTFQLINPSSIILLTCDPVTILKRLYKRDNSNYDLNTLRTMQQMEIEHAIHVSKRLNIPFFEIKNNDVELVYKFLEGI